MNRRSCVNNPDNFCYVCGKFTPNDQRKNLASKIKTAYWYYFGCKVGNQDKSWAPHICFTVCNSGLTQWLNGKRKAMAFAVPMVWREPQNHTTDCYFCTTNITGFNKKNKHNIVYPDCDSALKPVPHDVENPVPVPPSDIDIQTDDDEDNDDDRVDDAGDELYAVESEDKLPHLITQEELNDLVRDLSLSKEKAEILGSRLQEWNLLQEGTKISHFRDRHSALAAFYHMENDICFCTDIDGLMSELGYKHEVDEWRLFIDSGKISLKAVLIHNGNQKPSVPLAHAVGMKETFQSMEILLKVINYRNYNWNICGDLKVISLLLGLQLGYTKHMCFLCLWNSRDDENHFKVKNWPARTCSTVGRYNVQHLALVDPQKVYLPPLHIKLGLMKNFVKAMDTKRKGFLYLKEKFGNVLSDAKLKAGVFVGPQIRQLISDPVFPTKLSRLELNVWQSFVKVVNNFLGNYHADNYTDLVENMLKAYEKMGCRMSLKMHFLHSHLDFFPENLGAVSDEHGERFHQDIGTMETRYQGKYNPNMMGDYCWFLHRETDVEHKRQAKCLKHF